MRIGLVTDTHLPSTIRELWDEVRVAFAGVDLILHGGDIVSPRVLDWLDDIAPTRAARGNNDGGWEDPCSISSELGPPVEGVMQEVQGQHEDMLSGIFSPIKSNFSMESAESDRLLHTIATGSVSL